MNGGLNRLVASAFVASACVAGAALIAAPAALACSGGPSAYNVYRECLSNGGSGGGKHSGGSGNSSSTGGSQSGTTPAVSPAASKQAKKAIAQAGTDKGTLKNLYNGYGKERFLSASHPSTPVSEPTAIGSAFDIGPGQTALLIVVAGSGVLLLSGGGMRLWRQRRRA